MRRVHHLRERRQKKGERRQWRCQCRRRGRRWMELIIEHLRNLTNSKYPSTKPKTTTHIRRYRSIHPMRAWCNHRILKPWWALLHLVSARHAKHFILHSHRLRQRRKWWCHEHRSLKQRPRWHRRWSRHYSSIHLPRPIFISLHSHISLHCPHHRSNLLPAAVHL